MTTKRAVLFDLDGVIIDSESLYTVFWNDMDRLYPTGVENFAKVIKGSTLPRIFDTYFPDMEVRRHIISLLEKFEAEMEAELFPGICDMIEGLRAAGFATAIVTSSNLPKMQKLFARLPQIEKLMDVVLTEADVEKSKPDPEGYRKAAERLGCRPEDCVVFEDSFAGIEAGRRAGGKVVGVATTNAYSDIAPLVDLAVNNTNDVSAADLLGLFD